MLLAEGLEAGRGDRPVARLSTLSVKAGEAALLLGPSGAGKTTLLLALAGLARSFSGRVRIAETDILTLRGAALDRFRGRHIGFGRPAIHPRFRTPSRAIPRAIAWPRGSAIASHHMTRRANRPAR